MGVNVTGLYRALLYNSVMKLLMTKKSHGGYNSCLKFSFLWSRWREKEMVKIELLCHLLTDYSVLILWREGIARFHAVMASVAQVRYNFLVLP